MSTIVWVLVIVVSGMYGMPVRVEVTFDTEAQCEKAKTTVNAQRPLVVSCEPKKKP